MGCGSERRIRGKLVGRGGERGSSGSEAGSAGKCLVGLTMLRPLWGSELERNWGSG